MRALHLICSKRRPCGGGCARYRLTSEVEIGGNRLFTTLECSCNVAATLESLANKRCHFALSRADAHQGALLPIYQSLVPSLCRSCVTKIAPALADYG